MNVLNHRFELRPDRNTLYRVMPVAGVVLLVALLALSTPWVDSALPEATDLASDTPLPQLADALGTPTGTGVPDAASAFADWHGPLEELPPTF